MSSATDIAPAPVRRANCQLIALIEQAALSNKQFARAVRDTAVRHGYDARCTHTSVQRWRDGRMSRAVPPELIAETLSRALGRIVSTADIGMAGAGQANRPSWTAEFLGTPVELTATMRALWASDLDLLGSVRSEIPAAALSGPALHWLVADTAPPPVGHGAGSNSGAGTGSGTSTGTAAVSSAGHGTGIGHEVTAADLAGFRGTLHAFDLIARSTGGGAARLPAVQYLHTSLTPLLAGRYSGTVGRGLFGVAALAHLAIGRYTHDAGLHGLARRYLLLALCSAHQADDRALGAHVLAALAEHTTTAGEHPATANLVRAALSGTSGHSPRARAALHAAQARAQAARQDTGAAALSLARAARGLTQPVPAEADWLDYFGAAELADSALRCRLDLGEFAAVPAEFAAASAARRPGRVVDQVLAHCLLATAHLRLGEPARACAAIEAALDGAEGLRSATVADRLAQLGRDLEPHREAEQAAALIRRIRRLVQGFGADDTDGERGR